MEEEDDLKGSEPVAGLPELPPEGERILWQGAPNWWALASDALMVRWVAAYFLLLAVWRGWAGWADGGVAQGSGALMALLGAGFVTCGLLCLSAWIMARATVYTITNRRVAMRIGAALTVTLNLPYRWIGSADLQTKPNGTGTIALSLIGETRFSYLVIWPHARPWRIANSQPALRCIPDAEKVARILGEHARSAVTRGAGDAPLAAPETIAAE
ncbi:MAG: photosynthetic complex putative assembly protein PuhB [Pseudomonadota bacterium]